MLHLFVDSTEWLIWVFVSTLGGPYVGYRMARRGHRFETAMVFSLGFIVSTGVFAAAIAVYRHG